MFATDCYVSIPQGETLGGGQAHSRLYGLQYCRINKDRIDLRDITITLLHIDLVTVTSHALVQLKW